MALVNKPNSIIGIGITNGTKVINTPTTNSSAKILPKSRKLKDNGFVNVAHLETDLKKHNHYLFVRPPIW